MRASESYVMLRGDSKTMLFATFYFFSNAFNTYLLQLLEIIRCLEILNVILKEHRIIIIFKLLRIFVYYLRFHVPCRYKLLFFIRVYRSAASKSLAYCRGGAETNKIF